MLLWDYENQHMIGKINVSIMCVSKQLKLTTYKRIKFNYVYVSVPVSQVQVAAAASAVTGAPLHVATPMAQYLSHYPQAHPQTFQAPYAHMVRNKTVHIIKMVF